MISVVIPVLNGGSTLGEQLRALSQQQFAPEWELVVADNGSTDDTVAVAEAFAGALPHLRVVDASRTRGPAAARNIGAEASAGGTLAFCDADDIVSPGWLGALAAAGSEHDFVAGAIDFGSLAPPAPAAARAALWAPRVGSYGWLRFALGANMAVSRKAFLDVGGFAEELRAGEDVDLSWRLQLAGYPLHYQPLAVVHKRPRPSSRDKVLQHLDYGRHDVLLYKRLRRSGMPRRPLPTQARLYGWLAVNAWRVVSGPRGRATWMIAASGAVGRVIGSIQHRTLYL
ncbi:MAG: glycosyltransferase family 2 protein [Acidimicrobiales bacterium]